MGAKLLQYYAIAKEKGGLTLQMKLAMRTGMASPKAAVAADSPENLDLFFKSLKELLGQDPSLPRL